MQIALVKFPPLNKTYWFNPENHQLKKGDYVVVKTEIGTDLGLVDGFCQIDEKSYKDQEIKSIQRKANLTDIEKIKEKENHKEEDIKYAKELSKKHGLEIKITDIQYSLDGGRMTLYFTSPSRVDFRNLVKDLTHHFQKSVRLYQIGVRDEARCFGQVGPCGCTLCCHTFLDKLNQINSTHIEAQQIGHRGSDKLTGVCGRLKCCLEFECKQYQELCHKLPQIGERVKTKDGPGEVISLNPLKCSVDVKLNDKDKGTVEHIIKK